MTGARIGLQIENGKILAIRCLQEGEPSRVGKVLIERFLSVDSVWTLLLGGDVSTIRTHSRRDQDVVLLGRPNYAALYDHEEHYRIQAKKEGYLYLMRCDGLWYISEGGDSFVSLASK
jgi:hypothetical protein